MRKDSWKQNGMSNQKRQEKACAMKTKMVLWQEKKDQKLHAAKGEGRQDIFSACFPSGWDLTQPFPSLHFVLFPKPMPHYHSPSLCSSIQHINLVISESRCWKDLCHIPVPEFTKGWSCFIPFGQLHISVFVIYSSYHSSSRYLEVCMYSPVTKLKSQIV